MCAQKQSCSDSVKLIFACSGCVDVGEIADRTARKMTKDGTGQMFCLAGIGGRVEPIMHKAKQASKLLAIDGCELDCVKNCLEQAGFNEFEHLRLTDLGMEKGKAEVTDQNVDVAIHSGAGLLG